MTHNRYQVEGVTLRMEGGTDLFSKNLRAGSLVYDWETNIGVFVEDVKERVREKVRRIRRPWCERNIRVATDQKGIRVWETYDGLYKIEAVVALDPRNLWGSLVLMIRQLNEMLRGRVC